MSSSIRHLGCDEGVQDGEFLVEPDHVLPIHIPLCWHLHHSHQGDTRIIRERELLGAGSLKTNLVLNIVLLIMLNLPDALVW